MSLALAELSRLVSRRFVRLMAVLLIAPFAMIEASPKSLQRLRRRFDPERS